MTIRTDRGGLSVQASRPYSTQNVTVGSASAASVAFVTNATAPWPNAGGMISGSGQNTTHIRIASTTNCWLAFGAAPVASASAGMYLPANLPEYFFVNPGEKLAVIQDTAAGVLNIAELIS